VDCCTTDVAQTGALVDCPSCGSRGRTIEAITLDALLHAPAQRPPGAWRFCRQRTCPVVYYNTDDGSQLRVQALRVRVGQKDTAPDRPVCYCFGYSADDLITELRATGDSTIPDAIAAACRRGEDRCPETNPQGSCCLGNVRAVIEAASDEVPP
jgi:hypothetical protein